MTLEESLSRLEALGNEKVRKQHRKKGAGDNMYGVKMGDIRNLAKEIKSNHQLPMDLWVTKNIDARLLAVLIMNPKAPSAEDMDRMVRSVEFVNVADWLNSYVVKQHPQRETLRKEWMVSSDTMAARAGWNLTAERVAKDPDGLNIEHLLDRLQEEMGQKSPVVQWTMNIALANIGIHFPEHRERAIGIGEKVGLYRDYPVSEGCTSPFAPSWIKEMVSRQE